MLKPCHMKYKLTKKTKNDLADLSKMIPSAESGQVRNMIARGGAILKHKPNQKNEKGKDLDPNKFYQGEQKLFINHKKKLEEAYIHGGPDAVKGYLQKYFPDYGREGLAI